MRFKLDENFGSRCARLFPDAGHAGKPQQSGRAPFIPSVAAKREAEGGADFSHSFAPQAGNTITQTFL